MNTHPSRGTSFLHRLALALLPGCIVLAVAGCATTPAALEQSSRPVTGYLDYSYDKDPVLFNANERHAQTVFFESI